MFGRTPAPLFCGFLLSLVLFGCITGGDQISAPGDTGSPAPMNGEETETAGISEDAAFFPAPENERVLGGFEQVSVDREDVKEVLEWLKMELERTSEPVYFLAVVRADIQVVAGYNYRLLCSYRPSPEGKATPKILEARIYKRLDGVCELKEISYRSE